MGVWTTTDRGHDSLINALKDLAGQEVSAGIYSDAPRHEPKKGGESADMVKVGATMNFGTDKAFGKGIKIPKRPWFDIGTNEKSQEIWQSKADDIWEKACSDPVNAAKVLRTAPDRVGVAMEGTLKRGIKSPESLGGAAFAEPVRGGTPLYDTGQLINAITHKKRVHT